MQSRDSFDIPRSTSMDTSSLVPRPPFNTAIGMRLGYKLNELLFGESSNGSVTFSTKLNRSGS